MAEEVPSYLALGEVVVLSYQALVVVEVAVAVAYRPTFQAEEAEAVEEDRQVLGLFLA